MGNKTINPVIMVGTYIGLGIGILLSARGWYVFGWLAALIGINQGTPIALNIVGGMLAGYLAQIFWRILTFHISKEDKR